MSSTTKTTCPYCGVGCGIIATTTDKGEVSINGDPEHPANFGRLCSKGSALAETIGLDGRLLYPEVEQQKVNWDEALNKVASKLNDTINEYGRESIAFYVSGQLLTEDYYVANKLMKGFIGTANIDTNSRLCMSSAVAGHKRAFGSDTVPCDYADLEKANLIVLTGSNLAWCHPVIYQRIVQAKKDRPELKVVVIDPNKTATCDIADLHLPIKPGTDVMLFNGLLHFMQREGTLDLDYLEQYVEGFASTLNSCQQTASSIPVVAQHCNLLEQDLAEFYRCFSSTEKTVTVYSQGVNQSSSGTDKVNAIINCHLATGRIGKPGMGPFSMTGQPNAMGGREVGGLANQLAAHMDLENVTHRETVKQFWRSPFIADKPGLKAVELFDAIHSGDIKAVWIMATNPVVSLPNADHVRTALEKCEHVIVSDCVRHTDTTEVANILLPALSWGEKNGTVTNSERCISRQRPFLGAAGEAKPDWWIISKVAKRMGYSKGFNYQNSFEIFREHTELSAFHNNNERDFDLSALCEIGEASYDEFKPIQWPVKKSEKEMRFFADGNYFHGNGKARMIAVEPEAPANEPNHEYPLILNTGRVRDHWHTLTRTGKSPRLSSHTSEPYVVVHPQDANQFLLTENTLVEIQSVWGSMIARCRFSLQQQKGSVFVPMHWNKQFASNGRVDAIVNPATDPYSGQPESKHTPVMIKSAEMAWEGFYITRQESKPHTDYWVRSIGKKLNRFQIAGSSILDWSSWAKELMMEEGIDWLEYRDESIGRYRSAAIKNGQLMGCLFIAPSFEQLPDKSWLENLFLEETLDKIERACLLAGKPAKGEDNCGPTICSCFGVGRNTIINAILKYDLRSVEEIGKHLQAGTNCGSCVSELKQILNEKPRAVVNG